MHNNNSVRVFSSSTFYRSASSRLHMAGNIAPEASRGRANYCSKTELSLSHRTGGRPGMFCECGTQNLTTPASHYKSTMTLERHCSSIWKYMKEISLTNVAIIWAWVTNICIHGLCDFDCRTTVYKRSYTVLRQLLYHVKDVRLHTSKEQRGLSQSSKVP